MNNVLFIAYQSVDSPTMMSQGIAYINSLSKRGIRYSLLTYEKKQDVANSRNYISKESDSVKWRYLIYHKRPRLIVTTLDIALGILTSVYISVKDEINVIHARGFIPALISFLPAKLFGIKLFFDTRGLLADKYVGGGLIRKNSLTYKLMRLAEDYLLKRSDFLTVETVKHAQIIENTKKDIYAKMDIIPCCVDLDKFFYAPRNDYSNAEIKLVYLGKVGTWYLIEEMLKYFHTMTQEIKNTKFVFLSQDDKTRIYLLARKLGIEEAKIKVMRPLKEEIPFLLNEADAGIFFINPYMRYNSCPIKFGEYLACGLPVVTNAGIGDCDQIILEEEVGVVANDFSSEEYKKITYKLEKLLTKRDKLGIKCREAAEKHYSLKVGVDRYKKIYEKLMN